MNVDDACKTKGHEGEFIEAVEAMVLVALIASVGVVLEPWGWSNLLIGKLRRLRRLTDATAPQHHQVEYCVCGTRESVSGKEL